MAKKIYDIKPPKIVKKVEKEVKEIKEFFEKKPVVKHSRKKAEKKFPFLPVFAGAGVLLLIFAVYLFFKLPKAEITIWPKTDVLSFKEAITADKAISEISLENKTIPAQYLEQEKEGTEEFSATGSASNDGKASGTITVYNKYDKMEPLSLKAGTHFLSDSGKYFVTLSKITVPAGKKQGAKLVPGSVNVKVQAEESGPGYNIKPAKFSVPKLAGTPYYYSINGESFQAMAGGYTGNIKKVTEDDILQAKDSLGKKLSDEAKESLKKNISSEYILLDEAVSAEILSLSASVKPGTVADKFSYTAKVKAKGIIFKKSDVDKLAKDYLASQVKEGRIMLEPSYKIQYAFKSLDIQSGKISIDAEFSAQTYRNMDKLAVALYSAKKNPSEINSYINGNFGDEISEVKVNLSPYWVTLAPGNEKAVHVDFRFE